MDGSARRVAWAVMLLATSLLGFQLVLTRLFSVIIWNHFAFLAISIGLFGFGVAGVAVFVFDRVFTAERALRQMWMLCLALPLVMAAVVAVTCTLPVRMNFSGQMFTFLGVIFALATLPFFVGGTAITLALTHWPLHVNRIYAFDLAGSALGCGLVIGLLELLDGPSAAIALGVLPAAAAAVLRRPGVGLALLGLVAVGVGANQAEDLVRIRMARGRMQQPVFEAWNAFSRVAVSREAVQGWGLPEGHASPRLETMAIRIDGDALTPLVRFDGDLSRVGLVLEDVTAIGYHAHPDPRQVLVIGAGGGKDVLAALAAGAERVRAIELNPIIARDIVSGAFRDFTGDLYRHPRVELTVGEGRTVVRRDDARYDVVQVSMVDTSAASAAGAYSLTENSLYTVEAARELLGRLAPGGLLTTTAINVANLEAASRLVSIYAAALESLGHAPAAERIAVFGVAGANSPIRYRTVLVKPDGFSPEQTRRMAAAADALHFEALYLPGVANRAEAGTDAFVVAKLVRPDEAGAFFDWYRLDLRPVSDDRPFFFYQNRLGDLVAALSDWNPGTLWGNGLFILAKLLVIAGVAVLAFLLAPLLVARTASAGLRRSWPFLLYFFCLGAGFIALEIALVQMFGYYLGHPLLGLGVGLASLLLATGAGSALGGRWSDAALPRRLAATLGTIVAIAVLYGLGLRLVLQATLGWGTLARSALAIAVIAPLGIPLGTAFPGGLRLLGPSRRHLTPWMWAVNGGASVFGATVATMFVIHTGFSATLLAGAAIYAVALLDLLVRLRPRAAARP